MTNIEHSVSSRTCTVCGFVKGQKDFYLKGTRLESICKDCKREKSRNQYKAKTICRESSRWVEIAEKVLDFHLKRQVEIFADIDLLILRSSS